MNLIVNIKTELRTRLTDKQLSKFFKTHSKADYRIYNSEQYKRMKRYSIAIVSFSTLVALGTLTLIITTLIN